MKLPFNSLRRASAIVMLGVAAAIAQAGSPVDAEVEITDWIGSNAILLLDLERSICKPELKPGTKDRLTICHTDHPLPAQTRVRLIDHWRGGAQRLFIKLQYIDKGFLRTEWVGPAGNASIAKDEDRETFLSELDSIEEGGGLLLGNWELVEWDLRRDEPSTTGFLRITERKSANVYLGVFEGVVDPNYNQIGRARYPIATPYQTKTFSQPMEIFANGPVLQVTSMMRRKIDVYRVNMALLYKGDTLEGHASSSKWGEKNWSGLPRIVFRRNTEVEVPSDLFRVVEESVK